ncbi:uncharacterized protein LY79DRAFT_46368 [Colletotrichum navitas]|uniref:Uncharacterized protein n=1 Tax=Colletotrichum navitas TaxID=681940 RepID=A0AAD8PN05_9PEZI|nr:uncharacterized protein LY79DRAFT_46368 [Colletotrichum navitas]KAK1570237.1 hypothetical protein LY79DRAFT_46368 [Colletotrichum navitas]
MVLLQVWRRHFVPSIVCALWQVRRGAMQDNAGCCGIPRKRLQTGVQAAAPPWPGEAILSKAAPRNPNFDQCGGMPAMAIAMAIDNRCHRRLRGGSSQGPKNLATGIQLSNSRPPSWWCELMAGGWYFAWFVG